MKVTVNLPTELNVSTILVEAPVRYGTEDIPEDFPCRHGNLWKIKIDVDTGKIKNWPKGVSEAKSVHMKVCDEGKYFLYSGGRGAKELAKIEDYVPCCIPGEYGDYIVMEIQPDGTITDWKQKCTPENIRLSFFRSEDD